MTSRRWNRKQMLAEGQFAWAWLFLSAFFGATLSTALSLANFSNRMSISIPLLAACLLLLSAHILRFWRRKRVADRIRNVTVPQPVQIVAPSVVIARRQRYSLINILAILGLVGLLILMGLAVNLVMGSLMQR